MPIRVILLLAAIHFVADFLLQSDWMAVNKSKSWSALAAHIYVYSCTFLLCLLRLTHLSAPLVINFVMIAGVCHYVTDALTSRITSYLWAKEERHWFFVTIGFDQLLHTIQLVLTYTWLVK
jgi:hypothetical protein